MRRSCHPVANRFRGEPRRFNKLSRLRARIVPTSFVQFDDCDHRAAAMRALMHGVD
jgi:hypothetical protein